LRSLEVVFDDEWKHGVELGSGIFEDCLGDGAIGSFGQGAEDAELDLLRIFRGEVRDFGVDGLPDR
jgi:hypothetical protein